MADRDPEEEIKKAFSLFDDDGVSSSLFQSSPVSEPCRRVLDVPWRMALEAECVHVQTGSISLKNLRRVARELVQLCPPVLGVTRFRRHFVLAGGCPGRGVE